MVIGRTSKFFSQNVFDTALADEDVGRELLDLFADDVSKLGVATLADVPSAHDVSGPEQAVGLSQLDPLLGFLPGATHARPPEIMAVF
jgi:hypothetical protein